MPRSAASSRPCRSGSTRSRPRCCSSRSSSTGSTTPPSRQKLADPALAHYAPWLRDTRAFRPHQLSDEIEKLLHEKSVAGRAAWMRLFDETMAGLRFPFRRQGADRAPRRCTCSPTATGDAQGGGASRSARCSASNVRLFALVTNTLAKDKEIEDRWRGFTRPISSRNLAQFRRGRGGRRADLGGARRLSRAVAPLLPAEGEMVRRRAAALSGTATRRCPSEDDRIIPWPEARAHRARRLRRLLAGAGRGRPALLRQALDRRAGAAGQGAGRLRPSDGAERASLSAAELSGQDARRDDPGARAGPWRASGAGRRRRAR